MLFRRELKRNIKPFLITCLICSAMAMYMIVMSLSFGKDIQQLLDLKLPKEVQAALGMKGLDYSKATSFFALSFSYIFLFISIYVAGVFAIIVSKEFSEKTAEYLFSLPEKRIKIISTKLSVAFIYAISSVVVIFLASWLSLKINIKEGYELKPVVLMSLAWIIGSITFGSIAFLLSSFLIKTRSVSSVAIGVVLGMYLFQVVIGVSKNSEKLKYISLFDWFKGSEIAETGTLSLPYCVVAICIIIVSLFIGIRRYNKMDVLI